MHPVIFKCIVAMMLLPPIVASAQEKKIVNLEWSCNDKAKTGDTIVAAITIAVAPGWHVYAPVDINRMQQMQLTQVRFAPLPLGLRPVGTMQMPHEKQKGSFVVYEGENNRFVQLFVVEKAPGSDILLQGKLTYQACNQNTCFPPVTERFEKTILVTSKGGSQGEGHSNLPSMDSAKAFVEKASTMFAADGDYEEYEKLSPLGLKQYEDNHARQQANAALWYCKNYPVDSNYSKIVAVHLSADPFFIDSTASGALDTVTHYKGMDWTAFMRSLPINISERKTWLAQGDSLVAKALMNETSPEKREAIEYGLFARNYRVGATQFSFLPRKKSEGTYWSLIEHRYWSPVFESFQKHAHRYADLPILADRAQDFLAALKSRAPEVAARSWQLIEQSINADSYNASKKGYAALLEVTHAQLRALAIENGEKPMTMEFTSLNGRKFDLSKNKGKIVIVDFWASWCAPCVAELPSMRELYEKYKNKGLEMAGICLDDQSVLPKVQKIMKEYKVGWPQRFEGKGFQNDSYRLLYGINSLPTVWVVDGSGKIISTTARGPELHALIDKLITAKRN